MAAKTGRLNKIEIPSIPAYFSVFVAYVSFI